ncbi:von Willebrand factor type A domain-containing protein [Lentzea waywayandensis]|uniref:von Willebrand factor type A domain-containing protein n=1 Tax=Lentzea waywayandensis TaxID=84724 RepID=A0A1I6DEN0_9PSEU|nr:substrate-binding domain-containing protein [Lentzea waywayandensis]SFR03857.1 von Willebrand factor type A domain-containing protein [Lentzea waywayandensis]
MVRPRRVTAPVVGLSVLLVLSVVAWIGGDAVIDRLNATRCTDPVTVLVTAAPAVAPALSEAAAGLDSGDDCYRVEVRAEPARETMGRLVDGGESPSVWVPESTMWLRQARDSGAWRVPEAGISVARSPVVLAVKDAAKGKNWRELIGPGAKAVGGIADPAKDPASLSALLAMRGFASAEKDPAAATVASIRPVSADYAEQADDLFTRPLDVFPTSEQALERHNSTPGATRLTAVAAENPVPPLDFPYVVLPDVGETQRAGAEKFLAHLRSGPTLDRFGLRAPDDKAAGLDQGFVDETLRLWSGLTLTARVLGVLDVSGSMNQVVPRTGTTRMALAVAAAERGLGMFKPGTQIGLWKFSTRLDGDKDYREIIPFASVKDHLASGRALAEVRATRATANGATGLYDTTLAAYQEARKSWELGRINIVAIMTDGRNEDPDSISQRQLLDELAKLQDKRRPLPVIAIGMGPDVDVDELTRIADATGGRAFTTADPAGISDIFAQALSTMLCQPPACRPQ